MVTERFLAHASIQPPQPFAHFLALALARGEVTLCLEGGETKAVSPIGKYMMIFGSVAIVGVRVSLQERNECLGNLPISDQDQ